MVFSVAQKPHAGIIGVTLRDMFYVDAKRREQNCIDSWTLGKDMSIVNYIKCISVNIKAIYQ